MLTLADVDNCSDYDQLLEWKFELNKAIAHAKGQVNEAKQKAMQSGEYADPVWFIRAQDHARKLGVLMLHINEKMPAAKKIKQDESQITQERLFVKKAKEMLSQEQYLEIWDAVKTSLSQSDTRVK